MDLLVFIPVVILVALLALFVFRAVKYGSGTGALFKARITRTVGTLDVVNTTRGLRINVHSLQMQQPGWVGVEFQRDNGESWQITPLTLSNSEAIKLSELLAAAAGPA